MICYIRCVESFQCRLHCRTCPWNSLGQRSCVSVPYWLSNSICTLVQYNKLTRDDERLDSYDLRYQHYEAQATFDCTGPITIGWERSLDDEAILPIPPRAGRRQTADKQNALSTYSSGLGRCHFASSQYALRVSTAYNIATGVLVREYIVLHVCSKLDTSYRTLWQALSHLRWSSMPDGRGCLEL